MRNSRRRITLILFALLLLAVCTSISAPFAPAQTTAYATLDDYFYSAYTAFPTSSTAKTIEMKYLTSSPKIERDGHYFCYTLGSKFYLSASGVNIWSVSVGLVFVTLGSSEADYVYNCRRVDAKLACLGNGNWAAIPSTTTFASGGYWPYESSSNNGFLDIGDCRSFFTKVLEYWDFSSGLVTPLLGSPARCYAEWETYDGDGGGVADVYEFVNGTKLNDCYDDEKHDPDCVCGACCSCKCKCGLWSGATCTGKTGVGGCDVCHKECTCSENCCACKCACEAHSDGSAHQAHKNGQVSCTGKSGAGGCDECHKECTCGAYCCACECACEAHSDGSAHQAHGNGQVSCTGKSGAGGCDECHTNACTCGAHCSCVCTCGKWSGPICDKTDGPNGCSCHGSGDDEETCTCGNYCCACTCACKVCAKTGVHAAHRNGLYTCDKTDGPNGCSCHGSTSEENVYPDMPSFSDKSVKRSNEFISQYKFQRAGEKLENSISERFGITSIRGLFDTFDSTDAPTYSIPLPGDWGSIDMDLGVLNDYEFTSIFRTILVCVVYFETFLIVFNSLRKLL